MCVDSMIESGYSLHIVFGCKSIEGKSVAFVSIFLRNLNYSTRHVGHVSFKQHLQGLKFDGVLYG